MLNRRSILVGTLGVMLGALPLQTAHGQTGSWWNHRPAVEGQYTQIRFDGDNSTLSADGVGGKLMWSPAPLAASPSSLVGRTSAGLYGTYTPAQAVTSSTRFSSLSVGAVTEMRPLEAPVLGRVEPFVSVGAGLLRTNVERGVSPAPSPLLDRSRSAFTLTPGVGTRVRLTPGLALQGEVRDLVTFRTDTRHNVAFGAGLRLTF